MSNQTVKYVSWSDEAAKVFTAIFPDHRQKPSVKSNGVMFRAEQLATHEECSQVYLDHLAQALREIIEHKA